MAGIALLTKANIRTLLRICSNKWPGKYNWNSERKIFEPWRSYPPRPFYVSTAIVSTTFDHGGLYPPITSMYSETFQSFEDFAEYILLKIALLCWEIELNCTCDKSSSCGKWMNIAVIHTKQLRWGKSFRVRP